MKHRIVSLRLVGPPARKFLHCPSRASVPLPRRRYLSVEAERTRVSVCVRTWGPPSVPFGFCGTSWARSHPEGTHAPCACPDGSAAARGWAPVPSAHAPLPPAPAPPHPRLNFPPGREARVAPEEARSRGVERPLDRCVTSPSRFTFLKKLSHCALGEGGLRPGNPRVDFSGDYLGYRRGPRQHGNDDS